MGKLIVCTGRQASVPFHFVLTNTDIYSIEELCYYIYNNIYLMNDELFDHTIVEWLIHQAGMNKTGEKIEQLITRKHSMKDIVVSLLCSSDYYTEKEIKDLIRVMDEISNLPLVRRQKIKADNFLNYKDYKNAAKTYEDILASFDASILTEQEYGDIIHNQAVIAAHRHSFREAADKFLSAYKRNHKKDSLMQYLLALKIAGCHEEYESAGLEFLVDSIVKDNIEDLLEKKNQEAEQTVEYNEIQELYDLYDRDKEEYQEKIQGLLNTYKQIIRQEML